MWNVLMMVAAAECPPGAALRESAGPPIELWCERPSETGFAVKHGLWQRYWPNGELAMRGDFRDGRLHGAWNRWYPNGERRERGQFLSGARDGRWSFYNPEGKKIRDTNYRQGQHHGSERHYHPSGRARTESIYWDGVLDGHYKAWDPDGRVRTRGQHQAGEIDGVWDFMDADGEVFFSLRFDRGDLVEAPILDHADVSFPWVSTQSPYPTFYDDVLRAFLRLMAPDLDHCSRFVDRPRTIQLTWRVSDQAGIVDWRTTESSPKRVSACLNQAMDHWKLPYAPLSDTLVKAEILVR